MHDHSGVQLRHSVGIGNMLWSSDNPHHGNDWPYARKLISEMMADVDPSERNQLVAGNARRIYKLDKVQRSKTGGAVRVAAPKRAIARNGRGAAARASRNGARRTTAAKRAVSRNGARTARKAAARR